MTLVSRRALPALAGLVVMTAGCDPWSRSASPPAGPSPDQLLVDRLLVDVRRVRDLAAAAGLDALAAVHAAHLVILGAPSAPSAPSRVPSDLAANLGPAAASGAPATSPAWTSRLTLSFDSPTLRAEEESLKQQLTAGAVAAQEGSLARALASMAAAVAQQLEVLA